MGRSPPGDDDSEDLRSGLALGHPKSKGWPPGFRFHPTDEELVLYYLKRKVLGRRLMLPMIGDADVYKFEPWELPEMSALKTGDKQWYFFSLRDRKYPNGSRSNRATKHGYWKATGKDRTIAQNAKAKGNKKTLVYYQGRAPKGERTDWVMHEYTLDEQVLMNCNHIQDSYALYKVFRKSGPGPKNGEQYGAPFREEEWDDDVGDEDNSFENKNRERLPTSEHLNGFTPADNSGHAGDILPISDLEDLLLLVSDEQNTIEQYPQLPAYILEIDADREVGDHNMVSSVTNSTSAVQDVAWCDMSTSETNFQIVNPKSASLQPAEVPKITSFTYSAELGPAQTNEDFLEIEDFNDPEFSAWCIDPITNSDHIHGDDGLFDAYDYFDCSMFFQEGFEPVDAIADNSFGDNFYDDGMVNKSIGVTNMLWTHDQTLHDSAAAESNKVIMASPASGFAYDTLSNPGEKAEMQSSHATGTSESWFSSALSTLLDSVPSSPAIASEDALISRALARVSSFRSGRMGIEVPDAPKCPSAAASGRRTGHNGGFLFISFLVGLGAVFWVLTIGAVIKVFRGFWFRYISS